jgi:UDP-N-acetyl-2-amino-2-deoxyglucuronate dehydrogenase
MTNFALVGASGFVAPRHMKAVREVGGRLVAAVDPHDAAGALDRWAPEARFFTEIERFDRHLDRLRRGPAGDRVQYVSICSPNYLHDAHIRMALRAGADAICEKPIVINPWNLVALRTIEEETGRRVFTVLQLRHHPRILALRGRLAAARGGGRRQVALSCVTPRGPWYFVSWKGDEERSGGLAMNIGVHFFDLLLWLFGPASGLEVLRREPARMEGTLSLERADVRWSLSVDPADLPAAAAGGQRREVLRSLTVDGEEVEFSDGFEDLHTVVYREVLAGRGVGIEEARPSIDLVHRIRHAPVAGG